MNKKKLLCVICWVILDLNFFFFLCTSVFTCRLKALCFPQASYGQPCPTWTERHVTSTCWSFRPRTWWVRWVDYQVPPLWQSRSLTSTITLHASLAVRAHSVFHEFASHPDLSSALMKWYWSTCADCGKWIGVIFLKKTNMLHFSMWCFSAKGCLKFYRALEKVLCVRPESELCEVG